jgi:hypothetical protein
VKNCLACAAGLSDECRDHGRSREQRRLQMTTYTIDQENNLTAHASAKEPKSAPETERFSSSKELVRLAEKWPANRLVDIWNSLPGQTAVKKFTSRKTAVTRIWLATETLDANVGARGPRVAAKKGRRARNASQNPKTPTARDGSKKTDILALLRRQGGATRLFPLGRTNLFKI